MKLPIGIVTKHKIRDSKMCSLYAQEGITMEEIGSRFGISTSRVQQIIYRNRHLLEIDRKYEEIKQINRIKFHIKKSPESKKDVYDWETLLDNKITPKKLEHSGSIVHLEYKFSEDKNTFSNRDKNRLNEFSKN